MKSLIVLVLVSAAAAQVDLINDAIGDFSIRLLKETAGCSRGNTVFSPYSISTALGMCLLGAKEATFLNMQKGLGLDALNVTDIQDGYSDSVTELTPLAQVEEIPHGIVLSSANRLYVSDALPLNAHYLQSVRNVFHAKAVSADFAGNASGVQEEINSFVSNQTRKLIPKILDQPLNVNTVMTLVNALYFKGLWVTKMYERRSAQRFNAYSNGTNQKADWIGLEKKLGYAASESMRAEFIKVPYNSRTNSSVQASMLFILPEKSSSPRLGKWLASENFTWANISETIKSMKRVTVNLTLPKFKLESTFSLKRVLMDIGMDVPFTPKANFMEMVSKPEGKLVLDDVIHKAKIEVDEYGTEAAAATVVRVMFMSMPQRSAPIVNVTLDRSFIAMIILEQGDSIVPIFTSVVNKL